MHNTYLLKKENIVPRSPYLFGFFKQQQRTPPSPDACNTLYTCIITFLYSFSYSTKSDNPERKSLISVSFVEF